MLGPPAVVRPEAMATTDIDRVAELEQSLFPGDSPWTRDMFRAELADRQYKHYLVVRGVAGLVLGYAGIAVPPYAADPAEVMTIGVDTAARRRGIGRALLRELIAAAGDRRILLDVRTDNEPAQILYRSHGFVRIGVRRRYYQPSGADADTMERPACNPTGADHP